MVSPSPPMLANYPVDWKVVGGTARVTLTPYSLHPDEEWTTDNGDFCILTDSGSRTVRVDWTLTEQGNDEVYRGVLDVPVLGPQDAFALYRDLIARIGDDEGEDADDS
ncbi:hypothetical protein [Actinomycetospora atypica]|uniref:Uncharacterized protein n=1 Tax=Actinomycetospora atypica TaxID=1290095 RepID=A0ABV9YNV7_9PSEU